ncbi:TPA: beta-glucoside-specific PTS transporter subunit IIABC [Enterococcus faecium]|uniref:beta-glucoside-specific PTS transporter subunit IIABC n=1 Tax=Enterococcus TaxID=1350 RepID=UPI001157ED71|nr:MULTISPECIES: beta-glucoside-specific PTS transporter subunit IIABC [Enterococcus]EGO5972409.1 PTS transporter subunit EIIC [Enterococcus faecalis]MEB4765553.1 beta-glucoside-specific PTS transporter subunit IIABC [Enterococcus sp. E5-24]HBI6759852.1 PTS glucose transporter subunit IIA [Listeria monocytogenes]
MRDYTNLAKQLIQDVGGEKNIRSITHCMTRLRLQLVDESIVDDRAVSSREGVVTVVKSGGQYQIVIGNHVSDVYRAVIKNGGLAQLVDKEMTPEKQSIGEALTATISGIFAPILGTLSGVGIMKGLLAIAVFAGVLSTTDGTYTLLYSIGDGFFYFLPIILGMTAAEKFGGNRFIGIALGCSLVYPSLVSLSGGDPIGQAFANTIFATDYFSTFLGIPVLLPASGYPSSVVPVIIACYFAVKLEKIFIKVIPDLIKTFFVPLLTLAIIVPLTYLLIGPISTILCSIIGQIFSALFGFNGLLAGAALGFVFQFFVILGLHWGLVPLGLMNLGELGYDMIIPAALTTTFAQSAVVLAIYLKTKDQKLKKIALPAFISGMFGVTEPAIYGITLPKKKPFLISCVAAAVGGAIIGALGIRRFTMGGLGFFALATYMDPNSNNLSNVMWAAIAIGVAMIVAFVLTMVLYKDSVEVEDTEEVAVPNASSKGLQVDHINVFKPIKGSVVDLDTIDDQVFASGAMGKGIAIIPEEGKVYAPSNGTITALLPSGHAIGLTTEEGVELLIHIGMNTVELHGKYFSPQVSLNSKVKKGDLLMEFDLEKIAEAGYDLTTPIVITNSDDYLDIIPNKNSDLANEDLLLTLM